MRLLVLTAALALVPTAAGATGGGVAVSDSSSRPGARPVQLSLTFRTMLQCGSAAGVWNVTLPAAAHVPSSVDAGAVLVNRRAASKVAVDANRISVTVARSGGILCDIVAPGKVTLVFTRSAALGNPAHAGRYGLTVAHARTSLRGMLKIRS